MRLGSWAENLNFGKNGTLHSIVFPAFLWYFVFVYKISEPDQRVAFTSYKRQFKQFCLRITCVYFRTGTLESRSFNSPIPPRKPDSFFLPLLNRHVFNSPFSTPVSIVNMFLEIVCVYVWVCLLSYILSTIDFHRLYHQPQPVDVHVYCICMFNCSVRSSSSMNGILTHNYSLPLCFNFFLHF